MKALHINDNFKTEALKQFQEMLANYKPTDGALNFKIDPTANNNNNKVIINMLGDAYLKMISLIQECSIEIAWHGTVERVDDYTFQITDILCYPQEAGSATVDAKEEEYLQWLMQLDDAVVNQLSFQGHSHVNMGVSPSGRDTDNWQKLFQMCKKSDTFYIVCIANKSGNTTWQVYDNKTGYLYENKDIEFRVITPEGLSIKEWGKQTIDTYVTQAPPATDQTRDWRRQYSMYDTSAYTVNSALQDLRDSAAQSYDLFPNYVAGSTWNNNLQCWTRPKTRHNSHTIKPNKKGAKNK